jgi:hypothetical protein
MSEDTKESTIVLRLSDPKTWALVAALLGAQGLVGKLSVAGVEHQQEKVSATAVKAVEAQVSIDDKLEKLSSKQDQAWGEVRWRLEQVEKRMDEAVEKKGK